MRCAVSCRFLAAKVLQGTDHQMTAFTRPQCPRRRHYNAPSYHTFSAYFIAALTLYSLSTSLYQLLMAHSELIADKEVVKAQLRRVCETPRHSNSLRLLLALRHRKLPVLNMSSLHLHFPTLRISTAHGSTRGLKLVLTMLVTNNARRLRYLFLK